MLVDKATLSDGLDRVPAVDSGRATVPAQSVQHRPTASWVRTYALALVTVEAIAAAVIGACVVVTRPESSLTRGELVAWTKQRLAAYKYPRIVEFSESLPKGPTGKILKRELK